MSTTTFSAAPLKGSWEAQLTEAERLARNFNDACLPIFDKLYTRLGKMPKARRMAADERLQNIFLRAADSYQGYLLMREQYDRALEVIERMGKELGEAEAVDWNIHIALALHQAGRDDEALERMRPQPGPSADEKLNVWSTFVMFATKIERLDEAEKALAHIAQLIEKMTDLDEDDLHFERAYVASHHALIALQRQEWAESAEWIEEALSWNFELTYKYREVYQTIALKGPPDIALRLINQGVDNVTSFFFRGLAHHRAGDDAKARHNWEKVVTYEPGEDEGLPLLETILAYYYLGDPDRIGLELILRALSEMDSTDWALLLLAGLGWAFHGDMRNAHSNLENAMLLRRMTRPGAKYLPIELWQHAQLLLDDNFLPEIAPYLGMEIDQAASAAENKGEAG